MNTVSGILSVTAAVAVALIGTNVAAAQQASNASRVKHVIELPLIPGWYKGEKVAYIQTEASDPGVAAAQGVNYVPALASVLDATAVTYDDIYVVTNFAQANIIPSAPNPAGPKNTDPSYSPLWQVNKVTWANPAKAVTLKSEDEVLAAKNAGLVTVQKVHVIVNCPVIYTPQGGKLPNAELEGEYR